MLQKLKNPHPIDVAVGARVRTAREMQGITQEKLSAAVGVTFQQIQKYEKGTNRISVSRLVQICQALNISPNWLLVEYSSEGAAQANIESKLRAENDNLKSQIAEIRRIASVQ